MKSAQKIIYIILGIIISTWVFAHEGLHAAGQVHVGENHMDLLEVALAVIATVLVVAYQIKKYNSKK